MNILDDMQGGNLKIKIEQTEQMKLMKNLEKIVGKLTAGLMISALIISCALFITFSRLDYQFMGLPITLVLGGIGYFIAAVLGWRMIRAVVISSDEE